MVPKAHTGAHFFDPRPTKALNRSTLAGQGSIRTTNLALPQEFHTHKVKYAQLLQSCMHKAAFVFSAVPWVLSARSLGPRPSQLHQTKQGLMAAGSLNSKLSSPLFVLSPEPFQLLVTKHRGLPAPANGAKPSWDFALPLQQKLRWPPCFGPSHSPR